MKKKLSIRDMWVYIADKKAKPVKGYENLYYVTIDGDVISTKFFSKQKIMRLEHSINQYGYCCVNLIKDNKTRSFRVHRLVADAFIPNPNNYPQVNHINEVKTDNRVENLEWCTHEYNINYGTRNQRAGESLSRTLKNKKKLNSELINY